MHEAEKLSLEAIRGFVEASECLRLESESRKQVCGRIELVLRQQDYQQQGNAARGLLRRYVENIPGLSRAQVTRLIAQYMASGESKTAAYAHNSFAQRYTLADIEPLAAVDEAHETLSGPATRRIFEREFTVYGKREYVRRARISNGDLYIRRKSRRYRERRLNHTKTRPTAVSIGERRKPQQCGRPGYLRIDTVHQGDRPGGGPGAKGVFHINAVDQATQWQIVSATPFISETCLLPVLEARLRRFPFRARDSTPTTYLHRKEKLERREGPLASRMGCA